MVFWPAAWAVSAVYDESKVEVVVLDEDPSAVSPTALEGKPICVLCVTLLMLRQSHRPPRPWWTPLLAPSNVRGMKCWKMRRKLSC